MDRRDGLEPVDLVLRRVLDHGYAHHIERLMVLGNAMCLLRTDPDAAYEWFMEMFVDAYDWVMVPNVYAMSQFAVGEAITTKPYVSGSNYLRKMSDLPRGSGARTGTASTGPSSRPPRRPGGQPALTDGHPGYDGLAPATKARTPAAPPRGWTTGRRPDAAAARPRAGAGHRRRGDLRGTGRRCATPGCPPSSTTAGAPTPRT